MSKADPGPLLIFTWAGFFATICLCPYVLDMDSFLDTVTNVPLTPGCFLTRDRFTGRIDAFQFGASTFVVLLLPVL